MSKKQTYTLIAIGVLLIIACAGYYFSMHRGDAMSDGMGVKSAMGAGDQAKPMSKNNMMKPQPAVATTTAQMVQLQAGIAIHSPTTLTFDVTGGMFYFTPNVIHVKKGDTVKINFTSAGGFHDFSLDEFSLKIGPVGTGQSKSGEFVASKAGTYQFYCSVGSHRQMGQVGTLIVE